METYIIPPNDYPTYFRENRPRSEGLSALDNDAELALHLITFLRHSQNRSDGAWLHIDSRKTIRNVCHALESLYLLDIPAYTQEHLRNGVAWLINLPQPTRSADEEEDSPRLNPSRFKTLAWLNRFDNPLIFNDFNALQRRIDRHGLLQNILPRTYLATIIYLDTLDHLAHHAFHPPGGRHRQTEALRAIHQAALLWHEHPETTEPFYSLQELSYILDILLRYNCLPTDHPLIVEIRQQLITALDTHDDGQLLRSEALYYGIQLGQHFRRHPLAEEVISHLLTHLRKSYQNGDTAAQDFSFHPLVLRLLSTFHGPALSEAIYRQLVHTHDDQYLALKRDRQAKIDDEFSHVLRDQVQIRILDRRALTGGMRAERVYSIEFEAYIAAPNDEPAEPAYRSERQRIVIKTGPLADLSRAVAEYNNLPTNIKDLFATHAHAPYTLPTPRGSSGYLILQDLVHMQTLEEFLSDKDWPELTDARSQTLDDIVRHIGAALQTIHCESQIDHQQYAGDQLARLYFAPIEEAAIEMVRRHSRLKPELRGIIYNGRDYRSLNYYLRALQKRNASLSPSFLGLVHGDCHTRNVMVDSSKGRIMFIDLDHVNNMGDYVDDYAILIEDACLYRFLRDPAHPFHLRASAIHEEIAPGNPTAWRCDATAGAPIFKHPLSRRFQEAVLKQIERQARNTEDEANWRPRLWLATAARLFTLTTRVTHTPHAVFLYAEAIRLLDTLCQHLVDNIILPPLLFADAPPPSSPSQDERAAGEHLVAAVQRAFPDLTIRTRGPRSDLHDANGQLQALLLATSWPLRLALAADPASLAAIAPRVQPYGSGILRAVVDLPREISEAAPLTIACLRQLLP